MDQWFDMSIVDQLNNHPVNCSTHSKSEIKSCAIQKTWHRLHEGKASLFLVRPEQRNNVMAGGRVNVASK